MIKDLILVGILASSLGSCILKSPDQDTRKDPSIRVPMDPLVGDRVSNIIGVNYVSLTVKDSSFMAEYFQEAAQMEILNLNIEAAQSKIRIGPNENRGRTVVLRGKNGFVRLNELEKVSASDPDWVLPVQGPGITHICFLAPKTKPIDEQFIAHGGKWVTSTGGMVDMRGVGYMYGYLRAPDGTMIEVEHTPTPKISVDIWMSHVAIVTPDLNRLLEFYEKILGYRHHRRVDDVSGPTFDQVAGLENAQIDGAWFRVSPFYDIELWSFDSPATDKPVQPKKIETPGYHQIGLETVDIEMDFARIKSENISTITAIEKTLDGRVFYLLDPDGNLISFTQFDQGSPLSLTALNIADGL